MTIDLKSILLFINLEKEKKIIKKNIEKMTSQTNQLDYNKIYTALKRLYILKKHILPSYL